MKVRLISYSDLGPLVCGYAARVCTSAEMPECPDELAVTMKKDDERPFKKALEHALASGHESVLEHWSATFAIEGISRACSHQIVRHRLASYSQQSQRYVNMGGFEYVTPPSICGKKIGSTLDPITLQGYEFSLKEEYDAIMENLQSAYRRLVQKHGVPEEDARYILPNACCTNIVVTMNARELRHFFEERCCSRAQWEIREMAERMLDEVKKVAPVLFEGVGPKCLRLGYCPEAKGCGRMMPKEERE